MIQLNKVYIDAFDIFDSLFPNPFNELERIDEASLKSKVDEQNENYSVTLEVPGFEENEIDIEVHDGLLNIKAEHSEKPEHLCFYKKVNRSWTLPKNVKSEEIQAKLKNGILTVLVPKGSLPEPKKVKLLSG